MLRTSEDPSLLLQSMIDAIVDLSFPITTAYQEVIANLVINRRFVLLIIRKLMF